jgi:spermidine/putrescine transport system ATP-binding protein
VDSDLAESTPAIELRHVTKRYGDTVALDAVSMDIEPGEFFCLLGPSGCGKTTTLNLIGGFIPLSSGELRIEGRTVNDLPPHRRNVNTVFQNYALFPHMTVAENVAFGLRMEKLPAAEVARRTGEYLDLVGLGGFNRRLPFEMSGGQQQRVALARALAKRPAVLLLDEPLGALDLKLRKQMQTELSRIHRQVGTTFVFVTHDQEEALSMATRIAIMSGGSVMQTGTPREVYDHPVDRFVANFVGETNFISGSVATVDGRRVFAIPGRGRVAAPPSWSDGPATLMVRPEYVLLRPAGEPAADPGITGRIVNVAFLGDHTRITLTTDAGDIVAVRPHGSNVRSTHAEEDLGEEVCVWWPADDAALIAD